MIPKILAALAACLLLASVCLAAYQPVSDDLIVDRVMIKLTQDPVVKGGVQVDSKGGVVTLSGAVGTEKQRQRAAKVARTVKGVKQVINNVTLQERTAKQ
jgi:osmotically-inducible protein OsmY